MIIQENDFLRAYNDMSKLWEDISEDSIVTHRITEFKFIDVAKQAINDAEALASEELTLEQINYWCDLRALLDDKRYRIGDLPSSSWYDRFMRFYKAYLVESAIKDWFNKVAKIPCGFGDTLEADHHWLKPDAGLGQIMPDLIVSNRKAEYTIECKSCTATSSVHRANLVARHESIDNAIVGDLNVNFWIVGKSTSKAADQLFPEGGYPVYKIEPPLNLSSKFNPSGQAPTGTVQIDLPNVYKALIQINSYLATHDTAQKIKTAYIFNKKAKELDMIAKQELNLNLADTTVRELKDPVEAADQLITVTNDIVTATNK
jgi:hypothetical protein